MKGRWIMKEIVIVTRRMIMGGIEKSLISMLESIPKKNHNVTVLVMSKGGDLIEEIPKHIIVKCLYSNEKSTIEKIMNNIKEGRLINAIKIAKYTFLAKRADTFYEQEEYQSRMLPIINKQYDLAIAYHTPASFPVIYVMNNIIAKTKAVWIHSDVSEYKRELIPFSKYYNSYDKIYCVSRYAKNKFVEMYPNLKDKTDVFYNILDKKKIDLLSLKEEGFSDNFDGTRLLTIGRLTSQKGQDIIPGIMKKLLADGFNIKWYCIGDGGDREKLENLINEFHLEDHLILLGTIKNPYPYIKKCDLYVQPSRHEGYCITLAEARAFNKPIITTDFVGAREQIIDGETGFIVEFDKYNIYNQIYMLLKNYPLMQKLERNLAANDINHKQNINQLLNGNLV